VNSELRRLELQNGNRTRCVTVGWRLKFTIHNSLFIIELS